MKKLSVFILICGIILIVSPIANAQTVEIPNPLRWDNIEEVINGIIDFLKIIVIPIGTVMVIIGGLQYMLSGGSEEKVTKAKSTILYAIIGIVIVLSVKFIVGIVQEILGNATQ